MILNLKDLDKVAAQRYLQHAVAPRPICFASTIDAAGNVNLSPFSFFNLFSTNPPIVIFSPSRRVRDNTIKHSLQNVLEVPEVVINIVDETMVQQTSLASCDYPKGTNEFVKAGFTEQKATLVKPPMVQESKIKLECRVQEIKPLGTEGGAGNLVICEVLLMHIDDGILDESNNIDQTKISLIARLGADWYCRADPASLFKVAKPDILCGIGLDALPENIRTSRLLTGNQLGQLASVHVIPEIDPAFYDEEVARIVHYYSLNTADMETEMIRYAAKLLDNGHVREAWQVLLSCF
jgi:flavin reductase (DIM6/NTAB) family NADH-FMN oxidoreductase RutF